jgi:hypothetical protein
MLFLDDGRTPTWVTFAPHPNLPSGEGEKVRVMLFEISMQRSGYARSRFLSRDI